MAETPTKTEIRLPQGNKKMGFQSFVKFWNDVKERDSIRTGFWEQKILFIFAQNGCMIVNNVFKIINCFHS